MRANRWALGCLIFFMATGCVSKDRYDAQLARYDVLYAQHQHDAAELARARHAVAESTAKLRAMGLELATMGNEKEQLAQALADYRRRAEVLDRVRGRLELLRKKLEKLTSLGIEVHVRHNRMVISLPGDVLFESGEDELSEEGVDILGKVAGVIREDNTLVRRYYQVAGHTDNARLRGAVRDEFKDNWGLSLMRSRRVLLYMIASRKTLDGGGGLSQKRWSAAGYGATDPLATNRSVAGRKKNRRVELILLPDVEEMLDLRELV